MYKQPCGKSNFTGFFCCFDGGGEHDIELLTATAFESLQIWDLIEMPGCFECGDYFFNAGEKNYILSFLEVFAKTIPEVDNHFSLSRIFITSSRLTSPEVSPSSIALTIAISSRAYSTASRSKSVGSSNVSISAAFRISLSLVSSILCLIISGILRRCLCNKIAKRWNEAQKTKPIAQQGTMG